ASTNHPIASCEGLRASEIWLRAAGSQPRARRDGLALTKIRSWNVPGRPEAATFAKSMGRKGRKCTWPRSPFAQFDLVRYFRVLRRQRLSDQRPCSGIQMLWGKSQKLRTASHRREHTN